MPKEKTTPLSEQTDPRPKPGSESMENRKEEIAKVFQDDSIKKIEKPKRPGRLAFGIVSIAFLFGVVGGIAGEIVVNYWLLTGAVNLPWFNQLRLDQYLPTKEIVVTKREQITVAQDTLVSEMFKKIDDGQAVFFRSAAAESASTRVYAQNQVAGQGVFLTNDGWVVAPLSGFDGKPADYLGLDARGETFKIEKIIKDAFTGSVYLKTDAKNIRPLSFLRSDKMSEGMLVVARNSFVKKSFVTSVSAVLDNAFFPVEVSNKISRFVQLQDPLPSEAKGSAVATISGEIVGILLDGNQVLPSDVISGALKEAIRDEKFSRPFLGITGVSGSSFLEKPFAERKGIVIRSLDVKQTSIVSKSPAAKAGLRDGDVLATIDGEELTVQKGIGEHLLDYRPGDTIEVVYTRSGKERTADIKLETLP